MRLTLPLACMGLSLFSSCAPRTVQAPLNAPGPLLTDSCLWIDRMQNTGKTELGTFWYLGTDASNLGRSSLKEKNPAQAIKNGSLALHYHLDRGSFPWMPYVNLGFSLPDSLPLPWQELTGIRYEFRGPEHSLQWQSKLVGDYGWHQKTVSKSGEWTTVTVWINDLKQPAWAVRQKWSIASSKGISWSVSGKTGDEGSLEIRNIRFLKEKPVMKPKAPAVDPVLSHSEANLVLPIDSSHWLKAPSPVQVLRWPEGKKAAYSLSFDDGFENQIQVVAPLLDKYNLKATFFVIPPMLNDKDESTARYGSWESFKALSQAGHEIGAHTMTHPNLSQMELGSAGESGTMLYELWQSKLEIEKRVGQKVLSIAYPYGDVDDRVIQASRKLFVAGRNVNGIVNLQDFDGLNLKASSLNYRNPRDMQDDLDMKDILRVQILHNVIPSKALGVFFAHEVFDFETCKNKKDSWMPISTETFEPFLQWLAKEREEGDLWIAPLAQTVSYAKERDALRSGILAQKPNLLKIQLSSGLPKDVYSVPLDLNIQVPSNWQKVQIKGALSTEAQVLDSKVRVRALPESQIELIPIP